MKKNRVIALIFIIALVFSALVVSQVTNSGTDQACSTIIIKPDGSVKRTDKIQRSGNVYTLTDDVVNSTIIVTCNNIVIDGSGFTLQGTVWISGSCAINLTCSNVTVKNFNIVGVWEAGILGVYNGNTIVGNNITKTDRAISVYADGYHIEGNYLTGNHIGVRIEGKNNNVTHNRIVDNYKGFRITNGANNSIVANIIEHNMEAIVTDYGGFQVYHNNFINQSIEGSDEGSWEARVLSTSYYSSRTNVTLEPDWDNGYPAGGNYWSDYAVKYPNATEIDNTGIGNTAYLIGNPCAINSTRVNSYIVEAVDRYPLIAPFEIPEPAIPVSTPEPQHNPFPTVATITGVVIAVLVVGAGVGLSIRSTRKK